MFIFVKYYKHKITYTFITTYYLLLFSIVILSSLTVALLLSIHIINIGVLNNYLIQIVCFCQRCKAPISNVHFLRIVSLQYFIWMAQHSCSSIVFFDFLWVLYFCHAHSLPAVVRPQNVLEGAKEHLDVILHGTTTYPHIDLLFILHMSFFSVFSIKSFLFKHLLDNLGIGLFGRSLPWLLRSLLITVGMRLLRWWNIKVQPREAAKDVT